MQQQKQYVEEDNVTRMTALLRIVKHGYSLSWFKHWIFPYLGPKQHDIIQLRSYCKLFRDALNPLSSLWTSFPHPNYPKLNELMDALNRVYKKDPTKAPTIVFVMEGTFHGNGFVNINYPLMMIGAGRNKTFLTGCRGLRIGGTQEEGKRVNMQDFTMKGSSSHGLFASNGLSFLCKDMTFTQCRTGVYAMNTKGRLINCVITKCREIGIACRSNTLIELEGDQTKVDGNGTSGYGAYGLTTCNTSSKIHLLFPLTKESVSTNNHGAGNYGGPGAIETVASFNNNTNATSSTNK